MRNLGMREGNEVEAWGEKLGILLWRRHAGARPIEADPHEPMEHGEERWRAGRAGRLVFWLDQAGLAFKGAYEVLTRMCVYEYVCVRGM